MHKPHEERPDDSATAIIQEWKNAPLGKALARRLRAWWVSLDYPDPWPAELHEQIHAIDALPVCHRCFLPFEHHSGQLFCADCGAAVGPYNNLIPFIRNYSAGEVMRGGVGPEAHFSPFTVIGYLWWSSSQFMFLSVIYHIRFLRNILRKKRSADSAEEIARLSGMFKLALILTCVVNASLLAMWLPLLATNRHTSHRMSEPYQEGQREAGTNAYYVFEADSGLPLTAGTQVRRPSVGLAEPEELRTEASYEGWRDVTISKPSTQITPYATETITVYY